ncbi:hypothetical protein B0O80DRAFT_457951 [Mortierella sp. GBAus27b]|nr:hypothetical protein BGX31_009125 [Mortierella sp. GBA43]KAI8350507.1 hypothetical protein B0O80DRAFT_457951 [Mortierella sp. GBAus27b]
MLSVYSPLQIESTSSYPFHSEMRSSLSHSQQLNQERDQEKQQQQQPPSSQTPEDPASSRPSSFSSTTSSIYSKSSTTSTDASSVIFAHDDSKDPSGYYSRSTADQAAIKLESMIPSQMQAVSQSYSGYSSAGYDMKPMTSHFSSPQYMAPYPSQNRMGVHDRRQSMMSGHMKVATPTTPTSADMRTRADYAAPVVHSTLAESVSTVVSASHPAAWDPTQQLAQPLKQEPTESYSAVQPNLPPLSEALVASPPNFYTPNPYLDMQTPVNVYPQSQFDGDTKMASHGRRVTYPYVPALESGSGLVMSNVIPSEPTGSSPLMSNGPFTQAGIVGTSPVPVPGMPRASPVVDYVDSLALKQETAGMHPGAWPQNGADMMGSDVGANGKVYSFVPLSGVNSKKRPRRRFDEIERLYVCNWGDCEKAYGTLNHLNAHVSMQKHGPKRLPAEFKELRKAWRKHKRAEEEAAKQAAAFHQQQAQSQQAQLQPPLCDPVLAHMHPAAAAAAAHHPLAMHAMTHHQPHQLPHPHAHPNHAHPHHAPSQHHHHHPMGF